MQRSWLLRPKGLFHPHAADIHRSIIISIGGKPTVWAFVDSLGERLFHDASAVRTHLCRVAGIDLNEVRTGTFSLVREVRIYPGRKGGSTFIPGGKTGDFPLRLLHPRKLNGLVIPPGPLPQGRSPQRIHGESLAEGHACPTAAVRYVTCSRRHPPSVCMPYTAGVQKMFSVSHFW